MKRPELLVLPLLVALLALPPVPAKVDFSLSSLAISEPGLRRPCCIAYVGDGRWVVSDTGNDRVLVLGADLRIQASSARIFDHPRGVAVDLKGRIWVCDSGRNRIVVLNPDMSVSFTFGRNGSADAEFNLPWGVAIRSDGIVAVSDTLNRRIQIFDENGRFLRSIGKWGTNPGMFDGPLDLAFDPSGRLLVVDAYMEAEGYVRRVQIFNRNFSLNRTVWGIESRLRFQRPVGIGVSPDGIFAVADFFAQRIYLFDQQGDHMGGFSSSKAQPLLDTPFDIAFSNDLPGRQEIAIVEKEPGRVRILGFSLSAPTSPVSMLLALLSASVLIRKAHHGRAKYLH